MPGELKTKFFDAIKELNEKLFKRYLVSERAVKKELLATVLKCREDTQCVDLANIRVAMEHWKTPKQKFKAKADKFSEADTEKVIRFILKEGWHKNIILS